LNYLLHKSGPVVHDEFPFLGQVGANLLLIGVNSASRDRVESSLVGLGPVTRWEPGEQLVLPPAANTGTLILHEVGSLTNDDQMRLLVWLEEAEGRTRVVSTSAASLFARVEAGLFIEKLYYRLNTVSVNVAPGSGIRRAAIAANNSE
jgi:transcriptional regulator of acetoin/glycerol metabolism